MSIRNLDKIFQPATVAVVGASHDYSKVGYRVLRNMIGSGFSGVVFPVNPSRESVQGIQAFPNVAALPKTPDLAIICTPGPKVPGLVKECGDAGILGIIIVAAGFSEIGDVGKELEDQLRHEVANHPGMRVIGPNCLGVMVPGLGLNASFAAGMPKGGHVAFVSQSGALCTAVLDLALDLNVGFSHFVSIGNMVDVSFADLIDYLGEQNEAHSIILYVESITHAREFMSAARAFSAHEADRRLQGRPLPRVGARGCFSHGRHGRRRPCVRHRGGARRNRTSLPSERHVRLCRAAVPSPATGIVATGDRHQRGRARRHGHRHFDRAEGNAGDHLGRDV